MGPQVHPEGIEGMVGPPAEQFVRLALLFFSYPAHDRNAEGCHGSEGMGRRDRGGCPRIAAVLIHSPPGTAHQIAAADEDSALVKDSDKKGETR